MALLRSRSLDLNPVVVAHPGLERLHREQELRLDEVREQARAEAELALKERSAALAAAEKALEKRAAAAEVAARQKVEAEAAATLGALKKALGEAPGLLRRMTAEAESEMVRLAVALASRVLHREVTIDPDWLRGPLAAALAELPEQRAAILRLHPDDVAAGQRLCPTLVEPGATVEVIGDAGLKRGACRLECGGTEVEASLEAAWERVSKLILAMTPDAQGGEQVSS